MSHKRPISAIEYLVRVMPPGHDPPASIELSPELIQTIREGVRWALDIPPAVLRPVPDPGRKLTMADFHQMSRPMYREHDDPYEDERRMRGLAPDDPRRYGGHPSLEMRGPFVTAILGRCPVCGRPSRCDRLWAVPFPFPLQYPEEAFVFILDLRSEIACDGGTLLITCAEHSLADIWRQVSRTSRRRRDPGRKRRR